jgi:hypothetical protein
MAIICTQREQWGPTPWRPRLPSPRTTSARRSRAPFRQHVAWATRPPPPRPALYPTAAAAAGSRPATASNVDDYARTGLKDYRPSGVALQAGYGWFELGDELAGQQFVHPASRTELPHPPLHVALNRQLVCGGLLPVASARGRSRRTPVPPRRCTSARVRIHALFSPRPRSAALYCVPDPTGKQTARCRLSDSGGPHRCDVCVCVCVCCAGTAWHVGGGAWGRGDRGRPAARRCAGPATATGRGWREPGADGGGGEQHVPCSTDAGARSADRHKRPASSRPLRWGTCRRRR